MQNNTKKYTLFFPIIIAVIIFILSHQNRLPLPDYGLTIEDKIAHVIAYLIFGMSVMYSLQNLYPGFNYSRLKILVLIIGILYGASDEIHQYFVPGRSCDALDLISDSIGVYLSILMYPMFKKLVSAKRHV